jgi:hypothetical protein
LQETALLPLSRRIIALADGVTICILRNWKGYLVHILFLERCTVFIETHLIARSFSSGEKPGTSYFRNVGALLLNNQGKCSDISNKLDIVFKIQAQYIKLYAFFSRHVVLKKYTEETISRIFTFELATTWGEHSYPSLRIYLLLSSQILCILFSSFCLRVCMCFI